MTRFIQNYAGNTSHGRQHNQLQRGQAVVELALSLTVIVMFLGAAVDLGLAFKAYQTLVNATAEASNYLVITKGAVVCSEVGLPGTDQRACADTIARRRFQTEQGEGVIKRGKISTRDLDANGVVDDATLLEQRVRIDEADSTQMTPSGTEFADGISFDPANTAAVCKARSPNPSSTNESISRCYIVIRSEITYRPFILQPFLGNAMSIQAISVYPIQ